MNSMSHGTQDMFPTFLTRQRHYSVGVVTLVTIISMAGALSGGIIVGHLSDRWGRRRAMLTAVTVAVLLIPLWIAAPNIPMIVLGAFCMQFMVQGAWGVIPAHIIELSPHQLRGFFPGFAYQVGVLCASSIGYIESSIGEHLTYSTSMGIAMAVVIGCLWLIIKFGPEEHGKLFVMPKTEPTTSTGIEPQQLRPTGSD